MTSPGARSVGVTPSEAEPRAVPVGALAEGPGGTRATMGTVTGTDAAAPAEDRRTGDVSRTTHAPSTTGALTTGAPRTTGEDGVAVSGPVRTGTWIVLPTYNEAENVRGIAAAILEQVPDGTLLIVDDGSPDGTGTLADVLAREDPRIRVHHRRAKEGLGRAYMAGFGEALRQGAERVVQMDADWSHEPAYLPALLQPLEPDAGAGAADLVIGSRYVAGGGVRDWGLPRRIISRGGSLFARTVLGLAPRDLTGGFKAWRATTLARIPWRAVHSGGYVFQIETTYLASRLGARVTEVPIVFTDRREGQSKMSRRIIAEALLVVLRLRLAELRGRGPLQRRAGEPETPLA